MSTQKERELSILGQKIVVNTPEEEGLAEIAVNIVNQKVFDIQKQKPQLGPQQVAVLALLEIAGNMVKDRKVIDEYRNELDQRCSSLITELKRSSPMDHVV